MTKKVPQTHPLGDKAAGDSQIRQSTSTVPVITNAEVVDGHPPPYDRLPSYHTVANEEVPGDRGQLAAEPEGSFVARQYQKDLHHLLKVAAKSRRGATEAAALQRQLHGAKNVDEAHEIIARELAAMLDISPIHDATGAKDASSMLTEYSVDSLMKIRLATWVERSLGVKISLREFADAEISTLDEAATFIASRI